MTLKTRRWSLSESIEDEETARLYLEEILTDGEPEEIAGFIKAVAEGLGMAMLARGAGMARKDLDLLMTPYNEEYDGEALRKAAQRFIAFLPKHSDAA